MGKVLVVYSTKTGNTKEIAQFVAEGVRFTGHQAKIMQTDAIADPSELEAYDGLILGSATYGGQMMEEMKGFLEVAKSMNLEGKKGGAFGAYGWSGEAPDEIFTVMRNDMKMVMANDSLRLKAAEVAGGMKMAQDYGRQVGGLLGD